MKLIKTYHYFKAVNDYGEAIRAARQDVNPFDFASQFQLDALEKEYQEMQARVDYERAALTKRKLIAL